MSDKLADPLLLARIKRSSTTRHTRWKLCTLLLSFFFLSIALSNPQIGKKSEKIKRRGVDVMLAIDVSNSMLADDIAPNRLERTKTFVNQLLDQLQDNRVGLILFAGYAYMQMPLSTDFSAARLYLKTLKPDLIPQQGTAFAEAIALGNKSFDANDPKHKALILISDGENHEDGSVEKAIEAARDGLIIHTVGVGTAQGARIPDLENRNYKTNETGQYVISKLDETSLKNIASAARGKYFSIAAGADPFAIVREISQIEKKDFEARVFTDYNDQFHWLLLPAFLFLFGYIFLNERINWHKKGSLSSSKITRLLVLLLPVILCTPLKATTANRLLKKGNEYYAKGQYPQALSLYLLAREKENSFAAAYNGGTAYYHTDTTYESAITALRNAIAQSHNDTDKGKASYNLGCSLYRKNDLNQAYDAFKQALLYNPDDEDARYNLAYLKDKLKNDPQNQKDQENKEEHSEGENNKNQDPQQKNPESPKDEQENNDQHKDKQQQDKSAGDEKPDEKEDQKQGDKKGNGESQKEQDPNGVSQEQKEIESGNTAGQESEEQSARPGQMVKMKKEDAIRLLDAMRNEELKTQEKMMKLNAESKPQTRNKNKDW